MPSFSEPAVVCRRESCLTVGERRRDAFLVGISLTPWHGRNWSPGLAARRLRSPIDARGLPA
jgi:hypothetical protein